MICTRLIFVSAFGFATVAFSHFCFAEDLSEQLSRIETFVSTNCLDCHSSDDPEFGFDLEQFDFSEAPFSKAHFDAASWEKILRRLATRQMPPPDAVRPDENEYKQVTELISSVLQTRATTFPMVGRIGALRRMTRTEYPNAIRDLLGVDIDAAEFLPKDESSQGFDNITVESLSPTLMNRYISAAQKIARVAVGSIGNGPGGVTIRLPADRSQEEHVAGLPFGTRGGLVFDNHFPQTGEYAVELKLTRDRDEKVEGLNRKHDIHVLLDRRRVLEFTVKPPPGKEVWEERDFTHSDSHLQGRIKVTAGTHQIGVTFPKTSSSLEESKRKPFDTNFNRHRHPRKTPAIFQVSITGPFSPAGTGDTRSRRMIFGSMSRGANRSRNDAETIVRNLLRRAYRRAVTDEDMRAPMQFFDRDVENGGFKKGIESALTCILVNPNFLFKIEAHDKNAESVATIQPVTDFELASRLSYFLWSSIPDDELLLLAEQGKLNQDSVLRQQVTRMLTDEKALSLVSNFAAQWLHLRNLESITPDLRLFPDFDDNLRQSFRRETELLFQDVLMRNQNVLKLIKANHTYLNERLATHYGIPGVSGSHFRSVELKPDSHRGGILRHGSILMVTSYATRTSPTIRGNWIRENILGTPAPPPPPDVPNLKENTPLDETSIRERLKVHRENPACASCHNLMDPVGFTLENYDAVGRWRDITGNLQIDSKGVFPDGSRIDSVNELEAVILKRPENFVQTMIEKLMTFALGRAVEPTDGPTVRTIVEISRKHDYKFSSLVTGIVLSKPFRMRAAQDD